jgi:penicillin-binding protein 2
MDTFKNNELFPIPEGRYGKIEDPAGKGSWVEGAYGEAAWSAGAPNDDDKENAVGFMGLAATTGRVAAIFIAFAVVYLLIAFRVAYLVSQNAKFQALSENNSTRSLATPSPRGVIFDANGKQLVENVPDLKLAIIPSELPKDASLRDAGLAAVATIIGTGKEEIETQLEASKGKDYEPVVVGSALSHDEAVNLSIAEAEYPFIDIITGSHRFYTVSDSLPSLSHILGYTGRVGQADLANESAGYTPTDFVGKTGLESFYENQLRGAPQVQTVQVDATGKEKKIIGVKDATPGFNLKLNIDADLTAVAEQSLQKELDSHHLHRGSVVVMDAKGGAVRALVSLPAYSDNLFAAGISADEYDKLSDDPDHPLFPRAISGTYPSGSTVKLVLSAGALTEGIITPETTVNSTGGIMYGGQWFFPDWKLGGSGITDVRKAIAWSVNTFFYMIGGGYQSFVGLGIDRIDKYYALFGIGKKLGIDLPNEADGFLPTPQWKKQARGVEWYIGDTYHVSIGQGDLLVTPLQVAEWTAAVANGGTLWMPRVADAFVDDSGKVIQVIAPETIRTNLVPDEHLQVIREGMRGTVTYGSAQSLKTALVPVAGKTGTAQWASNKANHAWFTGFAPYENPQIVITVLLEEGGEGSSTAVPVAHEILDWWAKNRDSAYNGSVVSHSSSSTAN